MYELKKKLGSYLRVNLLGPGPRLIKKEFTGPRSHKDWETLPYNMSRKHRGGRTGTILLSHKFGSRKGSVVNVTFRQLCLREREQAPTVQEVGWTVDSGPYSRMRLSRTLLRWWTCTSLRLTVGIIVEVHFYRSSHGRHWISKETRAGRKRT